MQDFETLAEARAQRATYPDLKAANTAALLFTTAGNRAPSFPARNLTCGDEASMPSPKRPRRSELSPCPPYSTSSVSKTPTTDDGRLTGQQVAELVLALRQITTTASRPPISEAARGRDSFRSRDSRSFRRTAHASFAGPTATAAHRNSDLPRIYGCYRCRQRNHRVANCPFSADQLPSWERRLSDEEFYARFPFLSSNQSDTTSQKPPSAGNV